MKLSSLLLASLVESGRDWTLLDKYKLMRNSDFTTGGLLQPRVSLFSKYTVLNNGYFRSDFGRLIRKLRPHRLKFQHFSSKLNQNGRSNF